MAKLPEAGAQSTRWRRRQTVAPCHATVAGLSQSFHRRRPRSEKHRRRPAAEHRATLPCGGCKRGVQLRGGIYWPQAHTNVIRRLLTLSKRGTEVIYVTGNHDEFLRRYSSLILGNIRLVDEAVHSTADGRKLLVIHGDQFDVITRYHRWLAFLGDSAYEFTLLLNRWLNHWRRRWGYGYWSLSAYLKHKVKTAVNFISDFEEAIAHECHKRGLDGVVCGHIHHAEIRRIEGVDYLNCGDWVESCTALIEHWDGSIQLYRLAEEQARLAAQAAAVEPAA